MKKNYIFTPSFYLAAVMALSLLLSGIFTALSAQSHIEKSLVRLHILANSDSDFDQSVKLKVRDAVLEASPELFEPYSSSAQARSSLEAQLDEITQIANKALEENGSTDTAKCELTQMHINKRDYNNFSVPEGEYSALRITIGNGNGHNWWCVMYPPLCVPCAGVDMTDEEILEKYGTELTADDIALLTEEGYEPRLYIVDLIKKICE